MCFPKKQAKCLGHAYISLFYCGFHIQKGTERKFQIIKEIWPSFHPQVSPTFFFKYMILHNIFWWLSLTASCHGSRKIIFHYLRLVTPSVSFQTAFMRSIYDKVGSAAIVCQDGALVSWMLGSLCQMTSTSHLLFSCLQLLSGLSETLNVSQPYVTVRFILLSGRNGEIWRCSSPAIYTRPSTELSIWFKKKTCSC